jgi:hypothetical protein
MGADFHTPDLLAKTDFEIRISDFFNQIHGSHFLAPIFSVARRKDEKFFFLTSRAGA